MRVARRMINYFLNRQSFAKKSERTLLVICKVLGSLRLIRTSDRAIYTVVPWIMPGGKVPDVVFIE